MFFIVLTFLAAFTIEGLGSAVSVIGLSTLFGANPIIIALALALDAGKLVVVSLLYSYWNKLGVLMKSYALFAAVITMIITSAGAAGYLSGEFQHAIMGTQEGSVKVQVLKDQQLKYEERKKQIDLQISSLPEKTTVNQRLRLMNGFKAEQKDLQVKISEIDKLLPELQIKQIGVEAKAGPILYIAKAFDISVESAVKYVILMIIFVFDPLAVFLIIAGNFLLHQHRVHKETTVSAADLFEEAEPAPVPPPAPVVVPEAPAVVPEALTTDNLIKVHNWAPWREPVEEVPEPAEETKNWIPTWMTKEPEVLPEIVPEPEVLLEPEPEPEPEIVPEPEPEVLPEPEIVHEVLPEPEVNHQNSRHGLSAEEWRLQQIEKLDKLALETEKVKEKLEEREKITLSSLGFIKPDPATIVDASTEVGYKTGVYRS